MRKERSVSFVLVLGVVVVLISSLSTLHTSKGLQRILFSKGKYKPVTSFGNELCTPNASQPLRQVEGLFPDHANASRFFNLTTSPAFPHAANENAPRIPIVCEYSYKRPHAKHFPHAMQQLYACYSYFQLMSERRQDKQTPPELILLISPSLQESVETNAFLNGFVNLLETEMGVSVIDRSRYIEELEARGIDPSNEAVEVANVFVPSGYILSHVKELNQLMQSVRDRNSTGPKQTTDQSLCASKIPRIGFLNRQPSVGRSLENVQTLARTILSNISASSNDGQQLELPHIQYFEGGVTFEEQTGFFANVDILISPHGAQLTGVPFLANKPCTQMLEIFPENYLIPPFFGTLVRNSDIGYYYLYLSPTSMENYTTNDHEDASYAKVFGDTLESRVLARRANLCPAPNVIIDAVSVLMTSWRQCCQNRLDGENRDSLE